MMKKSLITFVTAVALTGTAIAAATPTFAAPAYSPAAFSAPTGFIQVHGPNKWRGHGHKRNGFKHRRHQQACAPVVRWKKVGHRHHRRWQQVVVGWNCDHARRNNRRSWNIRWR